jgi:hypothetical protein
LIEQTGEAFWTRTVSSFGFASLRRFSTVEKEEKNEKKKNQTGKAQNTERLRATAEYNKFNSEELANNSVERTQHSRAQHSTA